jgi:uncharacterized protein YukE
MAQPLYRYRPGAIIDGINDIRTAHNNIDTELDNLEIYAEGQMIHWDGPSREAYWNHKKEWNQRVDDMKDVMIHNAIPALNKILETYDTTERINTGMWQDG